MASIISAGTTSGTALNMAGDTSGVLQLATNGSTTALTIDTSQNVGIGTASPTAKLEVSVSQNSDTIIRAYNPNSGSSARAVMLLGNNTNPAASGIFANSSTNTTAMGGAESFNLYQGLSAPMTFITAAVERMRIESTGALLVNATSLPASAGGAKIFSFGSIAARNGFYCKAGVDATTYGNIFNINWTGSPQLWIDSTNVGTFAFTSDYRIKKNVETQTTPALDRIAQIRPVTYEFANYKELFKEDGVAREGFIAHELAEVIPSAVEGEKDAENQIQSLKLDALCSVMVKAIQEQQTIINDLKARITVLEGAA